MTTATATAPRWERCSPSLLSDGVPCAALPRRSPLPVEASGPADLGHLHWVGAGRGDTETFGPHDSADSPNCSRVPHGPLDCTADERAEHVPERSLPPAAEDVAQVRDELAKLGGDVDEFVDGHPAELRGAELLAWYQHTLAATEQRATTLHGLAFDEGGRSYRAAATRGRSSEDRAAVEQVVADAQNVPFVGPKQRTIAAAVLGWLHLDQKDSAHD